MASTLNGTHRAPAFYVPKVWNIKRKLWRYIWNIYKGKKLEKVYEIMGRISPTAIVIKPPAGWPFAKQTAVHFIVGACKQPLHRFLRCFSNWRKNFFSGGRLVDIGWRKISDWCFQWPQMQKWSFDQKAFPLNHINVIWNICSWRQPDNIYNSKQLM